MKTELSLGSIVWAGLGLLLLAAPVVLLAQSEGDRRRAVGDWLVEDVADEDGLRTIHLRRDEGDVSIDYHLWLRPGTTAIDGHGFLVGRLSCAKGMEETTEGRDATPAEAAPVRARLAGYLEECEAPPGEIAALLQGYDRAFALASEWAGERLAERTSRDMTATTDAAGAAENAARNAEAAADPAANAVDPK